MPNTQPPSNTPSTPQNVVSVGVCGAAGKMGQALLKTLLKKPERYKLTFAVGNQTGLGQDAAHLAGLSKPSGVLLANNLNNALKQSKPQVVVELTHAASVFHNTLAIVQQGIHCVVGASGLSSEQMHSLMSEAKAHNASLLFAPNFALGAVLMMKFAQEASKYFDSAEIIERHHEQKKDAPSGTALHTAALMQQARNTFNTHLPKDTKLLIEGARGALAEGNIAIHSLRQPGSLAHQEVIFGALGETLTIRHDTQNREAFMPGILMAVEKLLEHPGQHIGLETLL